MATGNRVTSLSHFLFLAPPLCESKWVIGVLDLYKALKDVRSTTLIVGVDKLVGAVLLVSLHSHWCRIDIVVVGVVVVGVVGVVGIVL